MKPARFSRRLAIAVGLLGAPALAEPPPGLELGWEAPAECPQADAVRARVRELTGSSVARSLSAEGAIERAQGRYQLKLVIRDGTAVSERTLESDACGDLGGAAAVALSLLLRGQAAAETSEPPAAEKPSPDALAAPPKAAPSPSRPPRESRARESGALGLHVGLQAPMATLDVGPLPKPSLGVAVGAGLHVEAWTFFALGQLSRTQEMESAEYPGFGARVSRVAGSVSVCRGFRRGRAMVSPCVALWLQHARATGVGLDLVPRTESVTWASPALGAVGHYRVLDFLAVVASVSGRVEGARPRLAVTGLGQLDRFAPASFLLAAGTEWIF